MKKEKQEWVTPLIKEMTINDSEGKEYAGKEAFTFSVFGPS